MPITDTQTRAWLLACNSARTKPQIYCMYRFIHEMGLTRADGAMAWVQAGCATAFAEEFGEHPFETIYARVKARFSRAAV